MSKDFVAGKTYKLTFGVRQTKKINEAANASDKTPKAYIRDSALEKAKDVCMQK